LEIQIYEDTDGSTFFIWRFHRSDIIRQGTGALEDQFF